MDLVINYVRVTRHKKKKKKLLSGGREVAVFHPEISAILK